nr:glutathione S-transferase [uncultured bacterium]AID57603.1 glutathione S-transferase [uncultured bacterium]
MLKLYFHPLSFPALMPIFTAEASGKPYEKIMVDIAAGAHKAPDYLKINPFGRIPAMSDGEFNLSESLAISRYIARDTSLYPNDAKAQGRIDQWADFSVHHIRINVGRIQFNRVVAPMMGSRVDESSIKLGLKLLGDNLPTIERRLSEFPFLCGDTMTMADISLLSALEPENMAKLDLSPFPELTAWLAARRSEAFYTNVHSHFGAEIGM